MCIPYTTYDPEMKKVTTTLNNALLALNTEWFVHLIKVMLKMTIQRNLSQIRLVKFHSLSFILFLFLALFF